MDVTLTMAAAFALFRKTQPAVAYRPLRGFRFSGLVLSEGIELHILDTTILMRVYTPVKCVTDSFKYRRKLGLDIALEAMRAYRAHPAFHNRHAAHCAQICRVDNVMYSYQETLRCPAISRLQCINACSIRRMLRGVPLINF